MSTVIGIDLGTTNSCVAVFRDEQAEVLKNLDDDLTTPSVVNLDTKSNEFIIGKIAVNKEEGFPEDTVRAIKRLMGKSYQQVIREQLHQGLNYKIVADENSRACIEILGHKYSPEEISAAILIYLKISAEEYLEEKITKAIIAVPVYFDKNQRQATINAGKIAGFNVVKLIDEATAVTLAYMQASNLKITKPETIAIYNLDNNTFEITIAEIKVDQAALENGIEANVLSYSGNNCLGGVNIDDALVKLFKEKFTKTHDLVLEDILSE